MESEPIFPEHYNLSKFGLSFKESLFVKESSNKAIAAVKNLSASLDITSLEKLGVKRGQLGLLATETLREDISIMTTPVDATTEDVLRVREKAF